MPWPTLALDDWKPVPRSIAIIELVFLALFLLYAALNSGHFLLLDFANLAIHEAGHPLFGIIGGNAEYCFGHTLMVLGGTLLELIVPAACAAYFFLRREPTGTACCCFWFFENFLYIASYMGDARTASQPLVGGDESDWTILFTQWHVLTHDTQIASITRTLGWLGMLASVTWFARHCLRRPSA